MMSTWHEHVCGHLETETEVVCADASWTLVCKGHGSTECAKYGLAFQDRRLCESLHLWPPEPLHKSGLEFLEP